MPSDWIITNAILPSFTYIHQKEFFFFFNWLLMVAWTSNPFFLGHIVHWTEWSTPAWSSPPAAGQSLSCSLFSGPGAHKAVPHTFSSLPLGVFVLFKHFLSQLPPSCLLGAWLSPLWGHWSQPCPAWGLSAWIPPLQFPTKTLTPEPPTDMTGELEMIFCSFLDKESDILEFDYHLLSSFFHCHW